MNVALPTKTDWFRIFADLNRQGYDLKKVSFFTGIPRTTLIEYRAGGEPPHYRGEVIVRFWREVTQLSELPTTPIYPRIGGPRGVRN